MREDGSTRQYAKDAGSDQYLAQGGNFDYLVHNEDGTWDEALLGTGYRYYYPAGNRVSLSYRETPHGYRLSYQYDAAQRLAAVEEPAGLRVTLGYAASGLPTVQYVQDWGDRRHTLTYDAAGDLIQEQGPTGCLTGYEYDAGHRITRIADPEGYETTCGFPGAGPQSGAPRAGNLGRYTYQEDAARNVTMTYADPLGRTWTHASSAQGLRLREHLESERDNLGGAVSRSPADGRSGSEDGTGSGSGDPRGSAPPLAPAGWIRCG